MNDEYKGLLELTLTDEELAEYYTTKKLNKNLYKNLYLNEYVIIKDKNGQYIDALKCKANDLYQVDYKVIANSFINNTIFL